MRETLVCRRCQCLPEVVRAGGERDALRCPRCGFSADLEEALELAGRYIVERDVDGVRDRIARALSSSKFIKYTRGRSPERLREPDFIPVENPRRC